MSEQRGKVQFRRIRGRIVPIRERVRSGDLALAGVASGGLTVGSGVVASSYMSTNTPTPEKMNKFRMDFPQAYREAGNPNIEIDRFKGAHSLAYKGRMPGQRRKGAYIGRRMKVVTNTGDEAILLHELGHLASARKKGTFNKEIRRTMVRSMRDIDKGRSLKGVGRTIRHLGKRIAVTNLFSEAEASFEAVRWAKKARGTRYAAKTAVKLLPPYLTYVGVSGFVGFMGAAAVKRTFFEGDKKK